MNSPIAQSVSPLFYPTVMNALFGGQGLGLNSLVGHGIGMQGLFGQGIVGVPGQTTGQGIVGVPGQTQFPGFGGIPQQITGVQTPSGQQLLWTVVNQAQIQGNMPLLSAIQQAYAQGNVQMLNAIVETQVRNQVVNSLVDPARAMLLQQQLGARNGSLLA